MYSPKISDLYIPKLYQIAKARRIPMTHLVNEIVYEAIKNLSVVEFEVQEGKTVYQVQEVNV